jgi:transporter family-2 protein
MELFYILLTLVAGIMMPIQPGINAQLAMMVNGPLVASLISFFVGTVTLFLYCLVVRIDWPTSQGLGQIPWWMWTGGVLGAFFVTVTVVVARELGAVSMLSLLIAGQMLAAVVLDHFGWAGFSVQGVSVLRLVGVVLLVTGAVMIQKF